MSLQILGNGQSDGLHWSKRRIKDESENARESKRGGWQVQGMRAWPGIHALRALSLALKSVSSASVMPPILLLQYKDKNQRSEFANLKKLMLLIHFWHMLDPRQAVGLHGNLAF